MKKNYMTPEMEVITMSLSNILAGSLEILKDSGEYDGTFNSPEFSFDEGNDLLLVE